MTQIDFTTWTVDKTPDRSYGMSYPYEKVFLNGVVVLEKFPFSPYMGQRKDYHFYIAHISNGQEFSVRINTSAGQAEFERGFESLQQAYQWAVEKIDSLSE